MSPQSKHEHRRWNVILSGGKNRKKEERWERVACEGSRERERERRRKTRRRELSGWSVCLGDAQTGGLFGHGHRGDARRGAMEKKWRGERFTQFTRGLKQFSSVINHQHIWSLSYRFKTFTTSTVACVLIKHLWKMFSMLLKALLCLRRAS